MTGERLEEERVYTALYRRTRMCDRLMSRAMQSNARSLPGTELKRAALGQRQQLSAPATRRASRWSSCAR